MSANIDFKNLDLQDALDLAILIEEEACERYKEFNRNIGSRYEGDAGDFFAKMAINETKHALQIMEKRKKLFGTVPSRVNASLIWDVEAPSQGRPRPFMSPRQAMVVALEGEIKAYTFFNEALKHVTHKDVKELFEHLREEEQEHKDSLEKMLKLEPPGDGPDLTDDDVDEPSSL